MKYAILESSSIDLLTKDVNAAISQGWIPQGGISADAYKFYQAVIYTPPKAYIGPR